MSERDPYYWDHADAYDAHISGVTGDVDFYRDLALEAAREDPEAVIVELGAGTGRIAIPSALAVAEAAPGARVVGLDLSAPMLALARVKAREAEATLDLGQADMRCWAFRRPAALVTIPFRAFLHNLTTDDQLATLRSAHDALRPGGRLALNVFNPNLAMIADWMRRGADEWEPRPQGDGGWQRHAYDPSSQRVDSVMRLRTRGGGGRRGERRVHVRLRYVHRFEMEHLLERAGLAIEALFGDHARAPFDVASSEMVWLVRRP